jgi:hypothetical protein
MVVSCSDGRGSAAWIQGQGHVLQGKKHGNLKGSFDHHGSYFFALKGGTHVIVQPTWDHSESAPS